MNFHLPFPHQDLPRPNYPEISCYSFDCLFFFVRFLSLSSLSQSLPLLSVDAVVIVIVVAIAVTVVAEIVVLVAAAVVVVAAFFAGVAMDLFFCASVLPQLGLDFKAAHVTKLEIKQRQLFHAMRQISSLT